MGNIWLFCLPISLYANIKCLSNFSEHMQMPCVCMTEADFNKLVIVNMKVIKVKDYPIIL